MRKSDVKKITVADIVALAVTAAVCIIGIVGIIRYAALGNAAALITIIAVQAAFICCCLAAWLGRCHILYVPVAAAGIVLYFFMNNAETTQFNADLLIQGIIAAAGAVACTVLAVIKRVRPGKLAAIIMVPAVLIVAVYGIVWGASTAAANGLTSAQTSIWSVPDKYEATDCPEQGSVEELTYATKAYATDGRTVEKRALVYLPYGYSEGREYDILYLLHGTGDDEEYWLKTNPYNKDMLDNLIYYGEIEPMIVVTPTWYVEDDCKGNLDPLTYSFKDELRNDLMPAVEGRYSTYAQSCDDAGFAASRSHRAFAGLSRGAVTTLHSVLNGCLDWFSRFGTFSGSRTPVEYFEEYACSEEQKGLSIDYWYLASGTFDFALSSQAEDYKAVLGIDSRLKEGENTSFDVFPMRYHSMGNWHLALYNFLIKAF